MLSILMRIGCGLSSFFIGIWLLRRGLAGMAGEAVRRGLARVAGSPLTACVWGCFLTALVQSSSAVTVITVGLTSAGVLNFRQAFGIVVGANVGTTATAQLISLRLESAWPFLVAGGVAWIGFCLILRAFLRGLGRFLAFGWFVLGLGLILCGVAVMESSLGVMGDVGWIYRTLALSSQNPVFAVAVGAALTGIVQSSSAVTAIVMALGRGGLVGLGGGVALVLGSNIGTCVTGLLSGAVAAPEGMAVAMAHFLYNFLGVLLILPFFGPFVNLVDLTSTDPARQIANAHLLFNVFSAFAILPFIVPISNWMARIYRVR